MQSRYSVFSLRFCRFLFLPLPLLIVAGRHCFYGTHDIYDIIHWWICPDFVNSASWDTYSELFLAESLGLTKGSTFWIIIMYNTVYNTVTVRWTVCCGCANVYSWAITVLWTVCCGYANVYSGAIYDVFPAAARRKIWPRKSHVSLRAAGVEELSARHVRCEGKIVTPLAYIC